MISETPVSSTGYAAATYHEIVVITCARFWIVFVTTSVMIAFVCSVSVSTVDMS